MEIALREQPWAEALIVPIGDLQLGAQGSCPDRLRKHIEEALKHPHPLFLGMGDMTDFMSPSNRARYKAFDPYDDTDNTIEDAALTLADKFVHLVRGTEGKWLGMLEGHHFMALRDGRTTDMYIAEKLGAPFLGSCAYVGVRFRRPNHEKSSVVTYTIACHHGVGSGAKNAAPLNKIENWLSTIHNADLVLVGHYTRMPSTAMDCLYPVWGKKPTLKARTIRAACTGGWFQGYVEGNRVGRVPRGGYPERGMMPAVTIGAPVYYVRPVHAEHEDYLTVREMK